LEGVRESREDDETGKGEESGEAGELEEKMDDAEEEETSSNPLTDRKQHSRSCSCPKEIIALIPHSGAKLGDEAGLTIVKRVREAGRKPHSSAMCQPHLQLLAAGAIRLYNKAGDKLWHRLEIVYRHRARLEKLRANKAKWFRRDRWPANPQDQRGSLWHAATVVQEKQFNFDEKLILERFTGKGSW
jgi:hypothetical protein